MTTTSPLAPPRPRASRPSLAGVIDALAAGDSAAVVTLITVFGPVLADAVLADAVLAPEAPDADAATLTVGQLPCLDRLVQEVALALADLAPTAPPGEEPESLVARAVAVVAGLTDGPRPDGPARPRPGDRRARPLADDERGSARRPRTLHLVDIENLAGGPGTSTAWVDLVWRQYQVVADLHAGDQVIMAAEKALWKRAVFVIGDGVHFHPAVGADGADNHLLREAPAGWVADRFDRLVIGSGDHAFAELAAAVRAERIDVRVVTAPGCLARSLRDNADDVRWLTGSSATSGVALRDEQLALFGGGLDLRVSAARLHDAERETVRPGGRADRAAPVAA